MQRGGARSAVEGVATTLTVDSGRNLALQLLASLLGGLPLELDRNNERTQLTSFGDGRYMGAEQAKELVGGGWIRKLLDLSQSSTQATWDRAHMLELAAGDALELPTLRWWLELHTFITGVQSKYLYWKGFGRVFLAAIGEMRKLGREDLLEMRSRAPPVGSIADAGSTDSELPGDLGGGQWYVEKILAQRTAGGVAGQECLVRWRGWCQEHDSRVREADIHTALVQRGGCREQHLAGTCSRMPASAARAQPAANPAPAHEPADSPRDTRAGISARVRGQLGRLAARYHLLRDARVAQSERKAYANTACAISTSS